MQEDKKAEATPAQIPPQPVSTWQFSGGQSEANYSQPGTSVDPITWTASEFIAHDKNTNWYLLLSVSTVLIAAFAYFLSREFITPSLICIAGVLFGIMGARKPRELEYKIDEHGVTIGGKLYSYGNFKSFSVVQEGAVESIWFMPLQRFMPSISIYFEPDEVIQITESLSRFLPVESRQLDPIDKLMHKIGF